MYGLGGYPRFSGACSGANDHIIFFDQFERFPLEHIRFERFRPWDADFAEDGFECRVDPGFAVIGH
jgi:hypothetical protein